MVHRGGGKRGERREIGRGREEERREEREKMRNEGWGLTSACAWTHGPGGRMGHVPTHVMRTWLYPRELLAWDTGKDKVR